MRMRLLAQQQLVDPIALLLIVAALGCLLIYLLVDEFAAPRDGSLPAKLVLICLIVALTVFLPSLKLVLLRQQSGPASYSHDGGVIQTEATIDYLLAGRNPYVEDYVNTPDGRVGHQRVPHRAVPLPVPAVDLPLFCAVQAAVARRSSAGTTSASSICCCLR